MSFALPYVLLLLPLPLAFMLLRPVWRTDALVVPRAVLENTRPRARRPLRANTLVLALAWIALVVALAGPAMSRASDVPPVSGRDIVLALDLSGSMEKKDFDLDGQPVSRLDAVKRTAAAFTRARKGDRIGLVIFGEQAYFAQPLTFDVDAVARAIEAAQIGISGRATAISDGLGLATRRLTEVSSPSRVVVLLSDGVNTSGTVGAVDAARLAASHGIRIHTIALGPADLETQPGERDAVDSRTLREMAAAGGGGAFRVRAMADLLAMAKTLDDLEPNPSRRPPMIVSQPLWHWPAALAFGLVLVAGVRTRS